MALGLAGDVVFGVAEGIHLELIDCESWLDVWCVCACVFLGGSGTCVGEIGSREVRFVLLCSRE